MKNFKLLSILLLSMLFMVACGDDDDENSLSGATFLPVSDVLENCNDPSENQSYTYDSNGCVDDVFVTLCTEFKFNSGSSGVIIAMGSVFGLPLTEETTFTYTLNGDAIELCFLEPDTQDEYCGSGTVDGDTITFSGVDTDGCNFTNVIRRK